MTNDQFMGCGSSAFVAHCLLSVLSIKKPALCLKSPALLSVLCLHVRCAIESGFMDSSNLKRCVRVFLALAVAVVLTISTSAVARQDQALEPTSPPPSPPPPNN